MHVNGPHPTLRNLRSRVTFDNKVIALFGTKTICPALGMGTGGLHRKHPKGIKIREPAGSYRNRRLKLNKNGAAARKARRTELVYN